MSCSGAVWKGLHLMKKFSCAAKCNVKPLNLLPKKSALFVQGRSNLQNWDLSLMLSTQGVQLTLDPPYCERYSLWFLFSTEEVTDLQVRCTSVVQLCQYKQLCRICDLSCFTICITLPYRDTVIEGKMLYKMTSKTFCYWASSVCQPTQTCKHAVLD